MFGEVSYFSLYLFLICIILSFLSLTLGHFLDLLHCTNEPNVSIPSMANLLIERTQHPNWTVVYKALITIHNIMCYGNEASWSLFCFYGSVSNIIISPFFQRFSQYLASCNTTFNLGNFLDKNSTSGRSSTAIDNSFIRLYPSLCSTTHMYEMDINPHVLKYGVLLLFISFQVFKPSRLMHYTALPALFAVYLWKCHLTWAIYVNEMFLRFAL